MVVMVDESLCVDASGGVVVPCGRQGINWWCGIVGVACRRIGGSWCRVKCACWSSGGLCCAQLSLMSAALGAWVKRQVRVVGSGVRRRLVALVRALFLDGMVGCGRQPVVSVLLMHVDGSQKGVGEGGRS